MPSDSKARSASAPQPFDHLTPPDLLRAASEQGLALTCERAEFDRSGLDFLVLHAHDTAGSPWIVRTPRRASVLEAARVEARVLALVAGYLPVAVPEWRVFSDEVIAYPRLAGVPAVTMDPGAGPSWNIIDPTAPCGAFIDSFAAALHALSSIPAEAVASAGIPRQSIAEARAELLELLQSTREALQPSPAVWARWQGWARNDALWPDSVALVHGDLHPGHLLLDDAGQLTGILDWTEAKQTDPSLDLAMFFGCFGQASLERLLCRLERCGARTWPGLIEHVKERWAAFPVVVADWALRSDNPEVLAHARAQLAGVAEQSS